MTAYLWTGWRNASGSWSSRSKPWPGGSPAYPRGREGFAEAGVADKPAEAARLVAETRPDLVLLGTESTAKAPLATLHRLLAVAPAARILLMGEATVPVCDILLAGVRGLPRAEANLEDLYKAVRMVVGGQYWVDREALRDVVQRLTNQSPNGTARTRDGSGLTACERQVAAAVFTWSIRTVRSPPASGSPRPPSRTT